MTEQHRAPDTPSFSKDGPGHQDETFERHGPEPPENDSGPSPSLEEVDRGADDTAQNADPNERGE
jgi:hypothetical protein